MADVKWTFFADTAAAERAIQRLEQQYAKLENAQSQMSRKSRDAASSVMAGLKMQAGSVASLVSGYLTLGNAVTTVYTENLKLAKLADDIATKFDVSIRKIRILANLDEVEGEKAEKQIHAVAQMMGFTNEQGTDAARELTSAGFDVKQATGPALEALFKSLAANQQFDASVDAGPLAKSAASYLQSQGQELNAENLERIGVYIAKLADVSTVAISDVQEIAKHGATLAGKMTQEEQFAAVTHLIQEGRPGSEAANAVEKVVLSLTGKGDKKKTLESLKEMGLTAEDVDMIGESYSEVMRRMAKGLESVPETRRATLMTKMFGVEHISSAQSLITKSPHVEELTQGQNDRTKFEAGVAIATSGRAAGERRLQAMLEEERAKKTGEYSDEAVLAAYEKAALEQGYSTPRIAFNKMGYNVYRGLGASQETAIGAIGVNTGSAADKTQKRIVELLETTAKSSSEQVDLIKRARPSLNRNAQGEAATQ